MQMFSERFNVEMRGHLRHLGIAVMIGLCLFAILGSECPPEPAEEPELDVYVQEQNLIRWILAKSKRTSLLPSAMSGVEPSTGPLRCLLKVGSPSLHERGISLTNL